MNAEQDFYAAISKYAPAVAKTVLRGLITPVYNVRYALKTNAEQVPKSGALVIANHQDFDDIPLSGMAWYALTERIPRYVMRNNLPVLYLKIGGIPIWRPNEIKAHLKTLRQRQESTDGFRSYVEKFNKNCSAYIASRIMEGQDVLIFPSGSRKSAEMHTGGIVSICESYQAFAHRPLPVVPFALQYGINRKVRRAVFCSIGKAQACSDALTIKTVLQDLENMLN